MTKFLLPLLAGAICLMTLGAAGAAPLGCSGEPSPSPAPPPIGLFEPTNIEITKRSLIAYRCDKYDADVGAVLAAARQWMEQRAPQVAEPAIVLDIDETSLSNWTEIYRDQFAYIPNGPCDLQKKGTACGLHKWEELAEAPALLPTLQLFDTAKCHHMAAGCTKVAVFFVTGRGPTERGFTERNLHRAGYFGWDGLYMSKGGKVAAFKTSARIAIEQRGYTIIANVGDQYSDLDGGHAERSFKVPNPFYFIP